MLLRARCDVRQAPERSAHEESVRGAQQLVQGVKDALRQAKFDKVWIVQREALRRDVHCWEVDFSIFFFHHVDDLGEELDIDDAGLLRVLLQHGLEDFKSFFLDLWEWTVGANLSDLKESSGIFGS